MPLDPVTKSRTDCYILSCVFDSSYISGSIIKQCTGFWWENLKEGPQLEDLGVDGRIIVKRILSVMGCYELSWFSSRYGYLAGFCVHSIEPLCSIQYEELFRWLRNLMFPEGPCPIAIVDWSIKTPSWMMFITRSAQLNNATTAIYISQHTLLQ